MLRDGADVARAHDRGEIDQEAHHPGGEGDDGALLDAVPAVARVIRCEDHLAGARVECKRGVEGRGAALHDDAVHRVERLERHGPRGTHRAAQQHTEHLLRDFFGGAPVGHHAAGADGEEHDPLVERLRQRVLGDLAQVPAEILALHLGHLERRRSHKCGGDVARRALRGLLTAEDIAAGRLLVRRQRLADNVLSEGGRVLDLGNRQQCCRPLTLHRLQH
mmetsp:Transcript_36680/g.113047  ORF Transcript_36680/g.113047 Transcript_36680/m.113047 type:complete len:220 (-) Transcript_36680:153-812(-)